MADKKKQPEDDMAEGLKSNLDKLLGRSSEENEGEPENARWPRFETPPPAVSKIGHRTPPSAGPDSGRQPIRNIQQASVPGIDRRNIEGYKTIAVSDIVQRDIDSGILEILTNVRKYIITRKDLSYPARIVALYLLEEGLATNQYEVDTSAREIAKKTGMSRATAGRAMDDLLEARVVLFLRGENQNLRSKIDILDIFLDYAARHELPVNRQTIVRGFFDKIGRKKNSTAPTLDILLYISRELEDQDPDLKDLKDLSIVSAVSNLGHRYRLNKQALFTLKSILYFFATYGLKIKSIPPTIFETMLKEVNVQGDALSRNIEYGKVMDRYMLVGRYVNENAKRSPWPFMKKLLDDDFTERYGSPEMLEGLNERMGTLTRLIETPKTVDILGAAELKKVAADFGIKIPMISPENIAGVRAAIKDHFARAAEDTEYVLRHYRVFSI